MYLGLYRTFKRTFVPYYGNGGGRDKYILYDNAGMFHNIPKSISPENIYRTGTVFSSKIIQKNKTQSIKVPNFHYHSDGRGRDKYILLNGGGLYTDSKPLISYRLSDFLRKNDIKYHKLGKISLSKAEIQYNKLIRDKEREIIKRLYTNEKKKFLKKSKTETFLFNKSEKTDDEKINENKINEFFTPRYDNNRTNILPVDIYKSSDKINKEKKYIFRNKFNIKYNKEKNDNEIKDNKKHILSPSFSSGESKDFYFDLEKINKFQALKNRNKKLMKLKKLPYFHVLNEHSTEK